MSCDDFVTCALLAACPVKQETLGVPQDDVTLPVARYTGMSNLALPERDPDTFAAWCAEMHKLQHEHLTGHTRHPQALQ